MNLRDTVPVLQDDLLVPGLARNMKGRDGKEWEGMGRDGKGWEGMGRNEKGWEGMGKDGK